MSILQKIQFAFKAKKAYDNIMEEKMKDGIKTTEFWMLVVSNLVTIVGALGGAIPAQTMAVIIAVLTGVYGVLRTLIKQPSITTIVEKTTVNVPAEKVSVKSEDQPEEGCVKLI